MSGAAADIRRAEPLQHHALAAELAGVAVDDVAAVLEVLDQPQPDPTAAQQACQHPLRVSIGAPVANDAVDEAGPHLEPRRGFQDRWEAPGPVLPVPGRRRTKTANGARG
jgi:hypothetical protein